MDQGTMRMRILVVTSLGALASSVFVACGSETTTRGSASSSKPNTFVLSEFAVVPPTNALHPGHLRLTADNVGGEVHELVIVRADTAGALPTKLDGSLDEDKISEHDKLGEIADLAAGSHATKAFDLPAGTYVAFCNIIDEMMKHSGMGSETGHVHFEEGMHATFTVS